MSVIYSVKHEESLTLPSTRPWWLHWERLRFTVALRQLKVDPKEIFWKDDDKQQATIAQDIQCSGFTHIHLINSNIHKFPHSPHRQPLHLRLNSRRQTWGLQGRFRIQFRRRGSSMMPRRCQRVMATHPSKSSTSVLLPIPGTDTPSRASAVPSKHLAARTF